MPPKVSICMFAYNQEKFIAQAIDSVLMQQTSFDYELVVGEDCSTDGTKQIVMYYREKNPDKIRLLLREKNLGIIKNYVQTINACYGQYVALLDADDYWLDDLKLQKQIDFLDMNTDFSMCCHHAKNIDERGISLNVYSSRPGNRDSYVIEDLFRHCNFIATSSAIFRRGLFGDFPDWWQEMEFPDWPLHILNALHGKIGFIPEVMSIYRIHSGGRYSGGNPVNNKKRKIRMYNYLNKIFDYKYNEIIEKAVAIQTGKLVNEYNATGNYKEAAECIRDYFSGYSINKHLLKIYLTNVFPNFFLP